MQDGGQAAASRICGAPPPLNTPPPREALGSAGYVPGVPRLGVPALQESDASLGVANGGQLRPGDQATALPSGLATASTCCGEAPSGVRSRMWATANSWPEKASGLLAMKLSISASVTTMRLSTSS